MLYVQISFPIVHTPVNRICCLQNNFAYIVTIAAEMCLCFVRKMKQNMFVLIRNIIQQFIIKKINHLEMVKLFSQNQNNRIEDTQQSIYHILLYSAVPRSYHGVLITMQLVILHTSYIETTHVCRFWCCTNLS